MIKDATATPWDYDDDGAIVQIGWRDKIGTTKILPVIVRKKDIANARQIVVSVNHHDPMVDMLREILNGDIIDYDAIKKLLSKIDFESGSVTTRGIYG